ncbi:O-antigen ligase domain-containing protein [Bacteroides intestinalis]|jgi:O-antigen ligase|uniref:O-antigen ligase domain-containing protein n=1 Tax=Bacteroides intestinalis TaxID=329854 RepID=A0A412Y2E7_9BACE|nr:O-antigen ligase family protein [Bacteroides intestinalis]RGV51597.1 O-antigen ligase domain-containing protein [Bacteroides intestinalis]RHA58033.1 O-antigen ligase domain-containing protein [Bacteroides intestinalis]
MAYNSRYPIRELPPQAVLVSVLLVGLIAITYAIITQKLLIAAIIISMPLAAIILFYGLQAPRFSYLIYATYSFFFIAIMRYTRTTGLSVILDILLVYMAISILFSFLRSKADIKLTNAINILTISYIPWILFILFQFLNPGIQSEGITKGIRIMILETFVLYIVSSLLADKPRTLKIGLITVGVFVTIAFFKLWCQKHFGFDYAEREWLVDTESWRTHIINTGIRYFSIFTDASNFGACMGLITTVYAIIGIHTHNKRLLYFYLAVAIMGLIGMFMSGTRGAIIIPIAGSALYCLLCKNIKIFATTALVGIFIFSFFVFTNIGEGNSFIRRMRTSFRPTEDASFNVRSENRKEIAIYLKNHPWGVGIDESIPKLWKKGDLYEEGTLPPDSYYVRIWIQTGYVGLNLYLAILIVVILRCCYIVMFRIKNKELHHILAALTCGVFGIWVNGYTGEAMNTAPTDFLIVASLAFIMNGPYIDKQITQEKSI